MFPVRYELNSYILFARKLVFKGLIKLTEKLCSRLTESML
jgi:hypothetical protein